MRKWYEMEFGQTRFRFHEVLVWQNNNLDLGLQVLYLINLPPMSANDTENWMLYNMAEAHDNFFKNVFKKKTS